jgi:hypothetical protein
MVWTSLTTSGLASEVSPRSTTVYAALKFTDATGDESGPTASHRTSCGRWRPSSNIEGRSGIDFGCVREATMMASTRAIYAQKTDDVRATAAVLGASTRGWCAHPEPRTRHRRPGGQRLCAAENLIARAEQPVVDTDAAMSPRAGCIHGGFTRTPGVRRLRSPAPNWTVGPMGVPGIGPDARVQPCSLGRHRRTEYP